MDDDIQDYDNCLAAVMQEIYNSCDADNKNEVTVSLLLNYIKPHMEMYIDELHDLESTLDPQKIDPKISRESFYSIMQNWVEKMKNIEEENCIPGSVEGDIAPIDQSTPKASAGHHLVRSYSKNVLNLSNISTYSTGNTSIMSERNILEENLKDLEQQYRKTCLELSLLKNQLREAEEQNSELQADLERTSKRLKSEQQINEHLQKTKDEVDEAKEETNQAKKEIDKLKKLLETSKKENLNLNSSIQLLQHEKLRLEKKLEDIRFKEQEAQKLIIDLQTEVSGKDRELQELENAKENLNAKLCEQNELLEHYTNSNELLKHEKVALQKKLKEPVFNRPETAAPNSQTSGIISHKTPPFFSTFHRPATRSSTPFHESPSVFKNLYKPQTFVRATFNSPKFLQQLRNPVSPGLESPIIRQKTSQLMVHNNNLPTEVDNKDSNQLTQVFVIARSPTEKELSILGKSYYNSVILDEPVADISCSSEDDSFLKFHAEASRSFEGESLLSEMSNVENLEEKQRTSDYEAKISELQLQVTNLEQFREKYIKLSLDFSKLGEEREDLLAKILTIKNSSSTTVGPSDTNLPPPDIKHLQNDLKDLTAKLITKNNDILELNQKIERNSETQRIIVEKLQHQLDQKCLQVESLNSENLKLNHAIEVLNMEMNLRKREYEVLEGENKKREALRSELLAKIEQLQLKISDLEQTNLGLTEKYSNKVTENNEYKNKLESKVIFIENLQENLDKEYNKNEDLLKEVEELREENTKMSKELGEKTKGYDMLHNERVFLQCEMKTFKDKVHHLTKTCTESEIKLREKETQLQKIIEQNNSFDCLIHSLTKNCTESELKLREKEEELLKLSSQNQSVDTIVDKIKKISNQSLFSNISTDSKAEVFVEKILKHTENELLQLQMLKDENERFLSRIKSLEEERNALLTEKKEILMAKENRAKSHEKLEQQVEKLQNDLSKTQKHSDINQSQSDGNLIKISTEKDQLEIENKQLSQQIAKLRHDLKTLAQEKQASDKSYQTEISNNEMRFYQEQLKLQETLKETERKYKTEVDTLEKQYFDLQNDNLSTVSNLTNSITLKDGEIFKIQHHLQFLKSENQVLQNVEDDLKNKLNNLEILLDDEKTKHIGLLQEKALDAEVFAKKLRALEEENSSLKKVEQYLENVLFKTSIALYSSTKYAYGNWKLFWEKNKMFDGKLANICKDMQTLIPTKEEKITSLIEDHLLQINKQLAVSTELLELLAISCPKESKIPEKIDQKRSILRPSKLIRSQTASPDSPSVDMQPPAGPMSCKKLFDLPTCKKSNSPDTSKETIPNEDDSNGNLQLKVAKTYEGIIQRMNSKEDISCQQAFPSQTDSFLESIGLDLNSPSKKLSLPETEEKFKALVMKWTLDAATAQQRYTDQKSRYWELREQYLKHLLKVVECLKNHKCSTAKNLKEAYCQIELLAKFVDEIFQSVEQCGSLLFEARQVKCLNLVTNYVALIHQENSQKKKSSLRSIRGASPTQSRIGNLRTDLSFNDFQPLETSNDLVDVLEAPLNIWRRAWENAPIYILATICFFILGYGYVHLKCTQSRPSSTSMCPLDSALDFLIKYTYSGMHPH